MHILENVFIHSWQLIWNHLSMWKNNLLTQSRLLSLASYTGFPTTWMGQWAAYDSPPCLIHTVHVCIQHCTLTCFIATGCGDGFIGLQIKQTTLWLWPVFSYGSTLVLKHPEILLFSHSRKHFNAFLSISLPLPHLSVPPVTLQPLPLFNLLSHLVCLQVLDATLHHYFSLLTRRACWCLSLL